MLAGRCDEEDGGAPVQVHDPGVVARCLEQRVDNFVRDRGLTREHELGRRLPASLRKRAAVVMGFVPPDSTFGEEVDGVITPPAPTALAFFGSAEGAGRFEERADERRGNVLVFFERDPTPSQRAAFDVCL